MVGFLHKWRVKQHSTAAVPSVNCHQLVTTLNYMIQPPYRMRFITSHTTGQVQVKYIRNTSDSVVGCPYATSVNNYWHQNSNEWYRSTCFIRWFIANEVYRQWMTICSLATPMCAVRENNPCWGAMKLTVVQSDLHFTDDLHITPSATWWPIWEWLVHILDRRLDFENQSNVSHSKILYSLHCWNKQQTIYMCVLCR